MAFVTKTLLPKLCRREGISEGFYYRGDGSPSRMGYTSSEKLEIIRLVEQSKISARRTLVK